MEKRYFVMVGLSCFASFINLKDAQDYAEQHKRLGTKAEVIKCNNTYEIELEE